MRKMLFFFLLLIILPQLSFASANLQGQPKARITNLEQQAATLQAELRRANQLIAQEQNAVKNNQIQNKSNKILYYLRAFISNIDLSLAIGLILLAGLILSWLFWPTRVEKIKNKQEPVILDGDEGDYDYLGSDEAVPAKLDLARAYIDMGDNSAARDMLEEVIDRGNRAQQAEASGLLSKL